jgi:long-subunit acyl-CoA synthetase (AMP-forming)
VRREDQRVDDPAHDLGASGQIRSGREDPALDGTLERDIGRVHGHRERTRAVDELIINSAGKNMSPANIENAIKAATPLIGAIAVIGDGRPYNTALVVLDAESAGPYAARHHLPDSSAAALSADAGVIERIAAGIAAGNARLSRVEQVKRFRLLPAFWEAGGDEVTLTMSGE